LATFLLATLTASLAGSLHCAGMCGPFVLMATGTQDRARRLTAYHLGRLVSYATLGAIAGAAGAALDLGGRAFGLQRAAASVAGVLLILFGLIALLRAFGRHLTHFTLPGTVQRFVQAGYRKTKLWPPAVRAAAIGSLSGLLPCGWLFLFVLTAAGTGSALRGASVTAAFWVGTLPALTVLAAGVAKLSTRLRAALPFATAVLCIAAGGHTLLVRAHADLTTLKPPAATADSRPSVEQIRKLADRPLPCCHAR
jgi:sulfite exporter TauE/SafE